MMVDVEMEPLNDDDQQQIHDRNLHEHTSSRKPSFRERVRKSITPYNIAGAISWIFILAALSFILVNLGGSAPRFGSFYVNSKYRHQDCYIIANSTQIINNTLLVSRSSEKTTLSFGIKMMVHLVQYDHVDDGYHVEFKPFTLDHTKYPFATKKAAKKYTAEHYETNLDTPRTCATMDGRDTIVDFKLDSSAVRGFAVWLILLIVAILAAVAQLILITIMCAKGKLRLSTIF